LTDVTVGLQVGCDGLSMARVVKMPARDITIFWIFFRAECCCKISESV